MTERPFTFEELALACQKMSWSKRTWLEDHGQGRKARPIHEIEEQRDLLAKLELMSEDYLEASARIAARQTERKTG